MTNRQDTIAAIATPPGRGGIGVIRISGPKSYQIAQQITDLDPIPRYAHYCAFHDPQDNEIDQGILIYFKSPRSFTGEDIVELHGHGGPVVMAALMKAVIAGGARQAEPGEFTERAFLNDKIDLLQAEAVSDLINSVSEQAARSAARSLQGDFSRRIEKLVESLISVRVFIEGSLDFPEEEIDFLKDSDVIERLNVIIQDIAQLLNNAITGSKIREGLKAVIIGRPNVGKSSLLNRLTGEERAIVTEIAGTTRDVIEDTITVGGITINVVDTAGLRDAEGVVEEEGIRRSVSEINKADIIILVTDTLETGQQEQAILREHDITEAKSIVVHNKIDLYKTQPAEARMFDNTDIYISAKTGEGIEQLRQKLSQLAGLEDYSENVVLARDRHIEAISSAKKIIEAATSAFQGTAQAELLAEELRKAQQELSRITGEFSSDDLLAEIFSKFCIGK